MADKIPQHVHCNMCWKAIPVDEKFCSDECKQKYTAMRRKGRILWYFLLVLAAGLTVMLLVSSN